MILGYYLANKATKTYRIGQLYKQKDIEENEFLVSFLQDEDNLLLPIFVKPEPEVEEDEELLKERREREKEREKEEDDDDEEHPPLQLDGGEITFEIPKEEEEDDIIIPEMPTPEIITEEKMTDEELTLAEDTTAKYLQKRQTDIAKIKKIFGILKKEEEEVYKRANRLQEALDYLQETQYHLSMSQELGVDIPTNVVEGRRQAYQIIQENSQNLPQQNEKYNLNDENVATFEFLTSNIAFGISVKEAKRLIGRRKRLKGFKNWDDVDKTWYIGADDLKTLKQYFTLGTYTKKDI